MTGAGIGVIGGSGLYQIEGLKNLEEREIRTPYGDPSDRYIIGDLQGVRVAFLPRHGRGHRIQPSDLNFRANIYGMKVLGVERIISVSAVGSMKEEVRPGDILIPDQFFDHTQRRISTFFGDGVVAHVSMAEPVCADLSKVLYESAVSTGATVHRGGTYFCIEGPQFSTRGESLIYRKWGVDVIGMTNVTEAKLAREAEICYGTIAMATDYDCWHHEEAHVTAEMILAILHRNVEISKKIIREALGKIPAERPCPCAQAIKNALVTQPDQIPLETKKRLEWIIGRYL
ncbi:MAG: S-methyl-5'-thioadenosine phosphorylase [Nitrospirae bacterium]|nr:S-methyl-5'-thioadenosine phosphorylase [Nitrospirota bacterium]